VRRLAAGKDAVPILLSRSLAEKLGVSPGDTLLPFEFPGQGGGFSPQPAAVQLTVAGYFGTGIPVFDDMMVLAPLDRMPPLGAESTREYSLGLRLADPLAAGAAAEALREAADRTGHLLYVYSWLESNRGLFQVIRLQKVMLFLVLMLIVVIAFFGMIGALVMLVTEKTREITILKSLGMEERRLGRVFLVQGLLIGVLGTALGVSLGLAICWVLDSFPIIHIPPGVYPGSDRVPVRVSGADIAAIVLGTLAVCLGATIFPSRKAVAMKPVDGLRAG
jgi:lipoprotein-releasing system permease protein